MNKGIKLPPISMVGSAWLLWLCNYLAGRYAGYPLLYCWFSGPLSSLYFQWGTLLLYAAFIYTAVQTLRGRMVEAIAAALIMSAVIELPSFGVYVFNSGGSCG